MNGSTDVFHFHAYAKSAEHKCSLLQQKIMPSYLSNLISLYNRIFALNMKTKLFFFVLQPKNAKNREELLKSVTEGITLPGIGHEILPQELVDEAIIISDMYNLNEYYALDLLCTGKKLKILRA